ncbi:hypothetical protein [Acinetobacter sp. ANC 4640]
MNLTPLPQFPALETLRLARRNNRRYIKPVWCKIIRLALVGYYYKGAYSPLRAFFMRCISMRLHIVMAELEGDTFECAGFLCSQSTNPFQFCHPHLVVNGKAPIYKGAHS